MSIFEAIDEKYVKERHASSTLRADVQKDNIGLDLASVNTPAVWARKVLEGVVRLLLPSKVSERERERD